MARSAGGDDVTDLQTVVAIVGGCLFLFVSVFSTAQGIRSKATLAASDDVNRLAIERADQLAKRVDEQDATIAAERSERLADQQKCAQEIAHLQGQLDAATSTWAKGLAPRIAAELGPLLTTIVREAVK